MAVLHGGTKPISGTIWLDTVVLTLVSIEPFSSNVELQQPMYTDSAERRRKRSERLLLRLHANHSSVRQWQTHIHGANQGPESALVLLRTRKALPRWHGRRHQPVSYHHWKKGSMLTECKVPQTAHNPFKHIRPRPRTLRTTFLQMANHLVALRRQARRLERPRPRRRTLLLQVRSTPRNEASWVWLLPVLQHSSCYSSNEQACVERDGSAGVVHFTWPMFWHSAFSVFYSGLIGYHICHARDRRLEEH